MTLPTRAEPENEPRRPQVDEAVARLQDTAERLDLTVGQLVDRLRPVLVNVDDAPQLTAAKPELVPLAGALHDVAYRIGRLQDVLAETLERLEL